MDNATTPADSKTQPNAADFKEKVGSTASASDKETPKDNAEKTADEKKPASDGAKTDPLPPAGEQPKGEEHDWKKRFEGVDKDHKRLSEEHQRTIETNVALVKKNPSILDDLVETNPNLADQVVQKAFGTDSYESYKKSQKLEELKETNPDEYETQKRLSTLENRERQRKESVKKSFYESKQIMVNDFDPAYKEVEKQLKLLNPQFVEENPERAYEMAFGIAFPAGKTAEQIAEEEKAKHLASQTVKGGGNSTTSMPTGDTGRFKNPDAKNFNEKFKSLAG